MFIGEALDQQVTWMLKILLKGPMPSMGEATLGSNRQLNEYELDHS
jgi:hypothetical protein